VAAEGLTESDGAYAAPFLLPGRYRVEVALPGFKKFVQSGIAVGVAQRATVDVILTLGEVTETVDVRAEASLLDRASGALGQTIDAKRVEDMPLNGRMIFMLNRLAAGVNWQVPTFGATGTSGLRPFDNGGGSAWSINGGQVSTNEFLLDGAAISARAIRTSARRVIYDPLTTTCNAAGQCTRTPLPDNVIPANRINAIALKLLSLYPLPTRSGQRLNNFVNPVNKARYDYDSELARIDHNFSDASKMFVSIHHNHRDEFRSTNGFQGTAANQGQWPQTRINRGGTADWVRLIGTRTVLNLRGGYTWFSEDVEQRQAKEFDRATLGFQNLPGMYLPRIALDQYNAPGGSTTSIGVASDGRGTSDQTASVQGNVTRDFAHHRMKVGGEHRLIRATPTTSGDYNGYFNFTRGYTQRDPNAGDNTSGNSVASFLLGFPAGGDFGGGNERNETWHYTGLYVQDDLRMSPRLTLNLGLRWDYESGVVDAGNRLIRGFAFDRP